MDYHDKSLDGKNILLWKITKERIDCTPNFGVPFSHMATRFLSMYTIFSSGHALNVSTITIQLFVNFE
jgi:hypothetical protein